MFSWFKIIPEHFCRPTYHPLRWYSINRVNNRTHRKSLVIDGRVGFTGGAGVADQWLGHAQDPEHWRDIQICYDREFAAQWAKIFTDDLAACRRVTLEEWRGRGAMTKLHEVIASPLRNQA